jgi:hypothetical protein
VPAAERCEPLRQIGDAKWCSQYCVCTKLSCQLETSGHMVVGYYYQPHCRRDLSQIDKAFATVGIMQISHHDHRSEDRPSQTNQRVARCEKWRDVETRALQLCG